MLSQGRTRRPTRAIVYRHSLDRAHHALARHARLLRAGDQRLQIFNAVAQPRRVGQERPGAPRARDRRRAECRRRRPTGYAQIFGHALHHDARARLHRDGMGGECPRAFPGWITLPGYQDLAGGRRWHLFFAWVLVAVRRGVFHRRHHAQGSGRDRLAPVGHSQAAADAAVLSALAQRPAAVRQVQSAAKGGVYGRSCSSSRR